jgi:hypothetical protein
MNGKCIDCGFEGKVQRHHVCYFPEMLQSLCIKCHNKKHSSELVKPIWISKDAYDYARKVAFDLNIPIGKAISNALLNNVKEVKQ